MGKVSSFVGGSSTFPLHFQSISQPSMSTANKKLKLRWQSFLCILIILVVSYFLVMGSMFEKDHKNSHRKISESSRPDVLNINSNSATIPNVKQEIDHSQNDSLKLPEVQSIRAFDQLFSLNIPSINRNLIILGILTNIDFKSFAIFAASLRQTARSSAAALLFIPSPATLNHQRIARQHQVVLIEYDLNRLFPSVLRKFHYTTYRWMLYHQLIQNNTAFFFPQDLSHRKKLLIVDVQDTFFQTDPFTNLLDEEIVDGLYVTATSKTKTIARDAQLMQGITQCFPQNTNKMIDRIQESLIVSNSIIYAPAKEIFSYLNIYSTFLLGQMKASPSSSSSLKEFLQNHRFPTCERKDIDEVVHNVLMSFSSQLFSFPVMVKNHLNFPVVHLKSVFNLLPHHPPSLTSKKSPDQLTQQDDSTVFYRPHSLTEKYSIVHQYDEVPGFGYILLQKYYPDLIHSQDHLQSEWKPLAGAIGATTSPTPTLSMASDACASFDSVLHYDLLKGQCDIISKPAMNAASCCELCQHFTSSPKDKNNCTSFVYHDNRCYLKSCSFDKIDQHLQKFSIFVELMKNDPSKLFTGASNQHRNKNMELMSSFHYQPHILFAYAKKRKS